MVETELAGSLHYSIHFRVKTHFYIRSGLGTMLQHWLVCNIVSINYFLTTAYGTEPMVIQMLYEVLQNFILGTVYLNSALSMVHQGTQQQALPVAINSTSYYHNLLTKTRGE